MSAGRTVQLLNRDPSFTQGFHKVHAASALVQGLAGQEQRGPRL